MRKVFLWAVVILANIAGLIITVVGPWPTYAASDVTRTASFRKVADAITAHTPGAASGPLSLKAGWGRRLITPEPGVPLAGYGERKGAPSQGVHDDLYVKALALSDGHNTAVLAGSDMLIVPENVADRVRELVAAKTPLTPGQILFSASHSHSGPGAWGPGLLAAAFGGAYNPAIVEFLAQGFADAIVAAYQDMKPAGIAEGSVDAPDYIRNRTREGPTDSALDWLLVRRDDGAQCYVVRYSAHPTVLGGSNMLASADYAGAVERALEASGAACAVYLGGAVGSMGPRPPEGGDGFARAEAMGQALAARVLEAASAPTFSRDVPIAAAGVPFDLLPIQLRLSKHWRLSPIFLRIAGVDNDGWLEGVRIGQVMIYGVPADFSGELSASLRERVAPRGIRLWVTSFNGDYAGYVSPAKYYYDVPKKGMEGYELYLMSWLGPNQEAFFTEALDGFVTALGFGAANTQGT